MEKPAEPGTPTGPDPSAAEDSWDDSGDDSGDDFWDDAACYRAIATRDPRFDGRLFTGVRTTGIYCRPVCPARTPKPENCRFFRSAAAAQAAGFRPCLRCRPETAPHQGAWLGSAGNRLSGGEARRLVLARVLLSQAPVVILDEPFTGVDEATRKRISPQISRWLQGRTVVCLGHGPDALLPSDRILHLG